MHFEIKIRNCESNRITLLIYSQNISLISLSRKSFCARKNEFLFHWNADNPLNMKRLGSLDSQEKKKHKSILK